VRAAIYDILHPFASDAGPIAAAIYAKIVRFTFTKMPTACLKIEPRRDRR